MVEARQEVDGPFGSLPRVLPFDPARSAMRQWVRSRHLAWLLGRRAPHPASAVIFRGGRFRQGKPVASSIIMAITAAMSSAMMVYQSLSVLPTCYQRPAD